MPDPVSIRPLTAQDGEEYQRVRLMALQTDPAAFLSTFDTESKKHEREFSWELENAYHPPLFGYYGAFDSTKDPEQLTAFVQLAPSWATKQAHLAFIYNLYIDPYYRHHGIGQQLFDHIFTELRLHKPQIERLFLSCNAQNKPAVQFYKKIGFKRCGVKPKAVKWQQEYDDEVEMVKVF